MPDGSLYAAEHEMSLQMEGLTKPRRKRGRPPKVHTEAESSVCDELYNHFYYFLCYTFFFYLYCISVKGNKREHHGSDKPRRRR